MRSVQRRAANLDLVDDRDEATADVEAAVTELFRWGRTWGKRLAERFDPPLPPLAFAILHYVNQHAPVRSNDIVGFFGMDKGAVSRQIASLRELGLLDATADVDDRRATLLAPTARATAAFSAFRDETRREYQNLLDGWSTGELRGFADQLTQFNKLLH
jgi:DNA-binding MarR family transcriptional regulator